MKANSFTETEIISIIQENESGTSVRELCRRYGFSDTTYYKWKTKYRGIADSGARQIRKMELKLNRLKRMYKAIHIEPFELNDFMGEKPIGQH